MMSSSEPKNYPDSTPNSISQLDQNSSLAKMLAFIGSEKHVIDFGCASGYFAKFLRENNCSVVGVDINAEAAAAAKQYCEHVFIADLDYDDINSLIGASKFDVAVFGDVLEHLKDPWKVLRSTRKILKENGCIVASIPNIAHGAVRLALLKGEFQYTQFGLLDNTHLRFFTRSSIRHLFEDSGYFVDAESTVVAPIFSNSEATPIISRNDVPENLVKEIEQDATAHVLQFIVRAYPWTMSGKYTALERAYQDIEKDLQVLHAEYSQLQDEYNNLKNNLHLMESSSFWKIRNLWLSFKKNMRIIR